MIGGSMLSMHAPREPDWDRRISEYEELFERSYRRLKTLWPKRYSTIPTGNGIYSRSDRGRVGDLLTDTKRHRDTIEHLKWCKENLAPLETEYSWTR